MYSRLENTAYAENNKVVGNLFYQIFCDAIVISSTRNSIVGNDFSQTGKGNTAYTCGNINITINNVVGVKEAKQNTITGNSFYTDDSTKTLFVVREDGNSNTADNIIVANSMRTYGYNFSVYTTGLSATTSREIAYNGNTAASLQQRPHQPE